MSKLRDQAINRYIETNYPNARILNFNAEDSDLQFYKTHELKDVVGDWFPISCTKDEETGEAVYGGRKRVFHTYTEGETGAGKTTRFVMQSIFALSSLKVKPSFVIVDIHGEIIENLYNHLKENGYKIKILNCDNPKRSDTYNPLAETISSVLEAKTIDIDAINRIRQIAEIIQPVESKNDPVWDMGARSYTNGAILDKFEDLLTGEIPPECINIYNVIQNHYWLRNKLNTVYPSNEIMGIDHYKEKGLNALSIQKMISVTNNADKTRSSYFGVIENHYDVYGQPTLYGLSSNSTIDITDFLDEPTVVVVQSGSTKIGDDLISLLVNEIYTYVVKRGRESRRKRLPRNIHCFLDEFANCNIASGPEFIKMLTTSRKFGMFWHMILQCDAQLDRKYDKEIATIIRANCTELFMGSNDYDTEVRFAKSCGQKTIESLSSEIEQNNPTLDVVDLMTADRLTRTDYGYVYVKSNRHPVTKSYIEAFYNCKEFSPVDNIDDIYPKNNFDYTKTRFTPDDCPARISEQEYKVLSYVRKTPHTIAEIREKFPLFNVEKIIESLNVNNFIKLLGNQKILSKVSKEKFKILQYRYTHHIRPVESGEADDSPFEFPKDAVDERRREAKTWIATTTEKNPYFSEILKISAEGDPNKIYEILERYTVIPDFMFEAFDCILEGLRYDSDPDFSEVVFPRDAINFRYDVIEAFIGKNDFETKKEWDEKIEEEVTALQNEGISSVKMMEPFWDAVSEFHESLELTNINEIKKILSADNEDAGEDSEDWK